MITIQAEYRKNTGTGSSRKIRTKNKCPAVIYGKNKINILVSFDQNILTKIEKNILQKSTIEIHVNDSNRTIYTVKVQNIQYHPYKKKIIHIDFLYLI